ncbi:MAG: S-ribosylhomocysteine lyase [Prevotellaceae bacterium]|nr:S-ribosylhomocysteine lyase [Candidatus Colivivens equi]MCQ2076058.1 S-ribosylhomocysteine lyase [Bacteroidaceae bacterium]
MNNKLEKIASFTIDHTVLKRGVYVSRKDKVGDNIVTTFDIRMKEPNKEPVLTNEAIHTIEHLVATYLRSDDEWKDRIIYWGPMGCLTGNYFIVSGDFCPNDILPLMRKAFQFVVDFQGKIPGTTPSECGNYKMHSLSEAQAESNKYLNEVLNENCPTVYL